ncbi:MAG TPA: gamma-glutamyl-gamma-aminobutyrate hydrolase family protein [Ktedonobacteraceae bacterium]|nr:gamma-glutamyl-gamma-aminobutyrate hydrolase family protein [Ktedonobacteraceae bacterium]
MRPVIGIPCQADFREGSKRPIYGNNRTYVHAVEDAGGLPILIPMLRDLHNLEDLLPRLDGILFSGGIDMQPSLYGEQKLVQTDDFDPLLDEFEIMVANWALQEDIPILGVCRGMQLLNVVLGGNLYQDIASQRADSLEHRRRDLPRTALTHAVNIEAGSLMEQVLGTNQVRINSLHHQAVKEPGKGVRISGRADDGVAELLEVPSHRFLLAIQGHPDEIYGQVEPFSKLFKAFVQACANMPVAPVAAPEKAAIPVALAQANL